MSIIMETQRRPFVLLLYVAIICYFGEFSRSQEVFYVENENIDRSSTITNLPFNQLKDFCSKTNYLYKYYNVKWNILQQVVSDKNACNQAMLQYPFDSLPEVSVDFKGPLILPVNGLLFPLHVGINRDNQLAKLTTETLHKHCSTVTQFLQNYKDEWNNRDQLELDNNFCKKLSINTDKSHSDPVTIIGKGETNLLPDQIDRSDEVAETTENPNPPSSSTTEVTTTVRPNDFKLPWPNCRLVINEFNSNTPYNNIAQFIELMQVCSSFHFSRAIKLDHFWLLVWDGAKNEIVMSLNLETCELKQVTYGKSKFKLFTVGSKLIKNVDLTLDDVPMVDSTNILPEGKENPFAIVLLYGNKKELKKLALPRSGPSYLPLKVDKTLLPIIKLYLQDMVVYGSAPLTQKCTVFEEIYPPFADTTKTYLIRDWLANPHSPDNSLNRCTKSFLPILPDSFMYAVPTPSAPNDCKHAFPFHMEEHMMDISDILEMVVGTNPTDERCYTHLYTPATYSSVQASSYSKAFTEEQTILAGRSSDVEVNTNPQEAMELDRLDDMLGRFSPPQPHTWQCNFDSQYDQHPEWKNYIQQYQSNLFDISVIESCQVKPWFKYIPKEDIRTSRYACSFCQEIIEKNVATIRPGKLDKIMTPDGELVSEGSETKRRNSRKQQNHINHPIHKIAIQYKMEVERQNTEEEIQEAMHRQSGELWKYYEATYNVFEAVYESVQMNLSFLQYQQLISYLRKIGHNIGIHYHDNFSMQRIGQFIGDEMHQLLIKHLLSNQPEVSIMIDSSRDIGGKHYLAVLFQTFDKNSRPHVFLYRMLQIGVSETAKDLFDVLWKAVVEDGLDQWLKDKLRGYSSDGAAVVRTAFLRLLKQKTNSNIVSNHCAAHRLDLVSSHAFKSFPFLMNIDTIVGDQYKFFNSRSGKRHSKLEEMIIEEEDSHFQLHNIIDIRWISSKFNAIRTILNHYGTIMSTYKSIESDKRFTRKDQARAEENMYQLSLRPVVSTMAFVEDLCDIFKVFSKLFQESSGSPIPIKRSKQNMLKRLEALRTTQGPFLSKVLKDAKCSKEQKQIYPCQLSDFEDREVYVELYGKTLHFIDDEDYPALTAKRSEYIDAFKSQLESYFPDDIFDSFSIFFPSTLPLNENEFDVFGITELKQLHSQFKWSFSEVDMLRDWKMLLKSLADHNKILQNRNLNVEDFWYYYMHSSVDAIEWSDITREIVRTVLVIPIGTASAERIFSVMNIIKTHKRSLLLPLVVEALVRIKFNGPKNSKDINIFHYTKLWCSKHATADDRSRKSSLPSDFTTESQSDSVLNIPSTLF